jgi:5-methylcytosine-specific restriction protein A
MRMTPFFMATFLSRRFWYIFTPPLTYGEVGKGFIEAHHLTPLYSLKGQKVTLDPRRDFSVLCSNCHRMIHRTEFVSKVAEFRAEYVVKNR